MLDETRVVLDNLVNHFQSISSRYNRKFTRAMTVRAEERRGDRRNAGRHRRGGREEPGAVRGAERSGLARGYSRREGLVAIAAQQLAHIKASSLRRLFLPLAGGLAEGR